MGKYIWMSAAVLFVLGVAYFIFVKKQKERIASTGSEKGEEQSNLMKVQKSQNELAIKIEMLPSLLEIEEESLVEVTDSKVLARINQVIPGAAHSAIAASNIAHTGEKLYKVTVPPGAKLTKSKDMAGDVRGFYRGAKKIRGQANLVEVSQKGTVVANTVSAAMNVASMVVG